MQAVQAITGHTPGTGAGTGTGTGANTPTAHISPRFAGEGNLGKDVHEEYHDPLDDWSARDILLSIIPFIVTYAFKDAALSTAITFAIAYAGFLLIHRTVWFDSKRKYIWPAIDIVGIIAFPILRGFIGRWPYQITKWWPIILPGIFATTGILTLVVRRPFTAHYARYPKFDRAGKGLWHGDSSYHRAADLSTLGWTAAWIIMLFLSLIPVLTGHWAGWSALNIIFNYVVPFVLLAGALGLQQIMGMWYRKRIGRATTATVGAAAVPDHHHHDRGAAYPAGTPGVGGVGYPAAGATPGVGAGTGAPTYATNV